MHFLKKVLNMPHPYGEKKMEPVMNLLLSPWQKIIPRHPTVNLSSIR